MGVGVGWGVRRMRKKERGCRRAVDAVDFTYASLEKPFFAASKKRFV